MFFIAPGVYLLIPKKRKCHIISFGCWALRQAQDRLLCIELGYGLRVASTSSIFYHPSPSSIFNLQSPHLLQERGPGGEVLKLADANI